MDVPEPEQDPARRRVLFVDDEVALLGLAMQALGRLGYEVIPAHNGQQALDVLDRQGGTLDAVVLDLVLPDIAAGELLERIHAARPDLPLIIASGLDREQAVGLIAGRGSFLRKPYALADLSDALATALVDR